MPLYPKNVSKRVTTLMYPLLHTSESYFLPLWSPLVHFHSILNTHSHATMESSFTLKPQAFSSISRNPVFPLSPCAVGLLRNDFIGRGHNLRLPRRRCKKLRTKLRSDYGKFHFRASLDSQPLLVIAAAVATVSAITVVYFSYSRKRFNIAEVM